VRIFSIVVSALVGVALTIVGIMGLTTFGSEGRLDLSSPALQTTEDGSALVIDVVAAETGVPFTELIGQTSIGAVSENGQRLFVGLSETGEVNKYLEGVEFTVVQLDGETWTTATVPGLRSPKPPLKQKFWDRRASGMSPSVEMPADRQATTFLVMQADGNPGVDASITVAYSSAWIFPLSIAAVVIGLALLALAAFLGYQYSRSRPQPQEVATAVLPEKVGRGS